MPVRPSDHGIVSASGAGGAVVLSGGTSFDYSGATFMKFTASGTLTVAGSGLVDYIVVGGGGSGGYNASYSNGGGGGGGCGGILFGSSYQLDASVKSTFTITVGAGGAGNTGTTGNSGGFSKITDFGRANGTGNVDWAGGSSYSGTGNSWGAAGGGGGGQGDWAVYIVGQTGIFGSSAAGSGGDLASGGGGGGGGGWDGYAGNSSGYGGNSHVNTDSAQEGLDTVTIENNDSSISTHYVEGRSGNSTNGGTGGNTGRSVLEGTAASPTFPGANSNTGDITSNNRGFVWLDGVRYGSPGAGGRGNWYDSADGGGRGSNQGGPLDALDNQGGGGAGAGGSAGGDGGSGIVIFRIVPV